MAKKKREPEAVGTVVTLEGERERTIALLTEQFAQDTLTMEDFERRVESAYRAATVPALRDLTKDLVPEPRPAPAADVSTRKAILAASEFAPEHERISSIFSELVRRGAWRPARFVHLRCMFAEAEIDLTQAVLSPGVTEFRLFTLAAEVRIIVPPGVRVVLQPSAFMSSVSDETMEPPAVGSGAPVVRITGRVLLSELRAVVRRREGDEGL